MTLWRAVVLVLVLQVAVLGAYYGAVRTGAPGGAERLAADPAGFVGRPLVLRGGGSARARACRFGDAVTGVVQRGGGGDAAECGVPVEIEPGEHHVVVEGDGGAVLWQGPVSVCRKGCRTNCLPGGRCAKRRRRQQGATPCVAFGIYSGYPERRKAVRETWVRWLERDEFVCSRYWFIETPGWRDGDELTKRQRAMRPSRAEITAEQAEHHDLAIIEGDDGWGLGMTERIVDFMDLADRQMPQLDFVALLDDDVFVWVRRLMNELRFRRRQGLALGFMFCRGADHTVLDERLIVLSADVAQQVLGMRDAVGLNTECNFGQALALWLSGSDITWLHDKRIINQRLNDDKFLRPERFSKLVAGIAVHHTNTTQMRVFYQHDLAVADSDAVEPRYEIVPGEDEPQKVRPVTDDEYCGNRVAMTHSNCMKITKGFMDKSTKVG